MSTKRVVAGALLLAVVGGLPAFAADDLLPPVPGPKELLPPPGVVPAPGPVAPGPGCPGVVYSPWNGNNTLPVLGGGPIGSETYLRTGPSIPVTGGIIDGRINTGWLVEGGLRT